MEQDPETSDSLGIAISEAIEDAATHDDTKYSLGSVLNHVLLHQTIVGLEIKEQLKLACDEADMVIGSRYLENNNREASRVRALGKWLLSTIISLLTGQRIKHSSSGYRAANRSVIHLLARMYPRDYPETETVGILIREKFRVKEIPVTMNKRGTGNSSITFVKGIYFVVKVIIAIVINMFEKRVLPKGA